MELPISYTENRIVHIPINSILPSPYEPRAVFDMQSLRDLAASIKTFGVINPVIARIINGKTYELVTGERRLRAAKMAGLTIIPAIVITISDTDAAAISLISGIQNQNLNFFEEAMGYYNLMEDCDIDINALSAKIGKSPIAITSKMKLLALPENIRKLILENGLTEDHARVLLKVPSKTVLEELTYRAINEALSAKKLDIIVEETLKNLCEIGGEAAVRKKFGDVRIINNTAKRAVELMKKSGVEADYTVEQTDDCFKIVVTIPYK